MYKTNLLKVIEYLEGRLDIYNGEHHGAVIAWDNAWDEMKCTGYDPEKASDIKRYIKNEL